MELIPLSKIFSSVKTGEFHASSKLEAGTVPLISCASEDNGVEGYFKIDDKDTYQNCVTIASDGQPLTAFYHPYRFGAKDNVLVCIPKKEIKISTIYYAVAAINSLKWRFSYGRKCYENKVKKIKVPFPVTPSREIDEAYIEGIIKVEMAKVAPKQNQTQTLTDAIELKLFRIDQLFTLKHGDFHSLAKLEKGSIPTVSRIETNNGVVGYYTPPQDATVYPKGLITVSTVSGDAFVQVDDFLVTDNVVVCYPKRRFRMTSLFFIQMMINRAKWRYSYGRQCYKTKFSRTEIYLPIKKDGTIDEEIMEKVTKNSSYWNYLENNFQPSPNIYANLLKFLPSG